MSNWWTPSRPSDAIYARPWLSPEAAQYFRTLLKREMRVLEHGAGGSTLWLARLVTEVTSVEHDPDWLGVVAKQTPKNSILILEKNGRLPPLDPPYDILFIDGEPVENRGLYLLAARQLVKSGGWVILDNANRPEYAAARVEFSKCAALIATFDSNKSNGFLHLITEFWRVE